jgi:hypothetical protein
LDTSELTRANEILNKIGASIWKKKPWMES